jgi:hypothetical protein
MTDCTNCRKKQEGNAKCCHIKNVYMKLNFIEVSGHNRDSSQT